MSDCLSKCRYYWAVSQLFDLCHPITPVMPVYPGDPAVRFAAAATITNDGCAVTELRLGSHTGTHLDAPSHTVPGAPAVSAIDPARLICQAVVINAADLLRGGSDSSPPEIADAALSRRVRETVGGSRYPAAVLFSFDWCRFWGTDRYFLHPSVPLSTVQLLAELGVTVFGTDTASPDSATADAASADSASAEDSRPAKANPGAATACGAVPALPVHDFWLGRNGLILENLRGLNQLLRDSAAGSGVSGSADEPATQAVYGELIALPLRLDGCDGSPVRAVFRTC